jgi:hypothetical protein
MDEKLDLTRNHLIRINALNLACKYMDSVTRFAKIQIDQGHQVDLDLNPSETIKKVENYIKNGKLE